MHDRKFQQVTNNLGTSMKHDFSKVPSADIPRSTFDRSHAHKTTFDAGSLIPVFVDEVLPGDSFNLEATFFARMATPLFPIMDNLFLDSFFFFVPYRLLWENWERMNGAQTNPGDSTDYTIPQVTLTPDDVFPGSIFDYFGIPNNHTTNNITISALPFRAYNLIYSEWFRDQNLIDYAYVETDDGPDTTSNYNIQPRGKRHDYFTSCLPWPQKGDAVVLPLGGLAPVAPDTTNLYVPGANSNESYFTPSNTGVPSINTVGTYYDSVTDNTYMGPAGNLSEDGSVLQYGYNSYSWYGAGTGVGLVADLSQATASTINALRFAFQTQRLLERDARGGTRFTEILRSHFGVVSPDARLQRPEYLGGGETNINIHPVAQTAGVAGPVGALSAFGTAVSHRGHNHGFTKSFVEHGVVIGLVSVRADLTYQNGTERFWWRQTRFDFYWPVFAALGEQAVLNREIWTQGTTGSEPTDDSVFGYQEAWAEYRYKPSRISGLFRSTAADTLDTWHLAQEFGTVPTLGSSFINDSPPMGRVEAVDDQPDFLFDSYFRLICARPMPVYSVPGLIDHF